jgi:Ice-binding-like
VLVPHCAQRGVPLPRRFTIARVPVFAVAAASAACIAGSAELESVTAEPHTMSTTQALADGSLKAINGTYGSGCLQRSGSWSLLVSGTGALTNAPLTVVKDNTACVLTLTSLVADQTYTPVSSIDMSASYLDVASAFEAGVGGPVEFYANAKLDSASFAGDFVVTVLVSGDPSAARSAVTGGVLGKASSFAVLAGSTITCGASTPMIMVGDIGVSAVTTLSTIPSDQPEGGSRYVGPGSLAVQAQTDLTAGYNALHGMTCPPATNNLSGKDLGGQVLIPGVYCFDTSANITGTLELDADGNTDPFWVFQIGSTLTTGLSAQVTMPSGGSACRVYWNVGSSATLGADTAFLGTILAGDAITLGTGATVLTGRTLAQGGAVTLDGNTISAAACQ